MNALPKLTDHIDFNNPQGALLGVINAAFSIGAVLALPVVPYVRMLFPIKVLEDLRRGQLTRLDRSTINSAASTPSPLARCYSSLVLSYRRPRSIVRLPLVLSCSGTLLIQLLTVAMFLVARLLLGTGIPFCISGASQLIAELAYPREAGVLNGLFNESWYVGAIIAAGTTLGTFARADEWVCH
jgi:hypothetical protein